MFLRHRSSLLLPLLCLALAGCGGGEAAKAAPKTIEHRFAIGLGARTVQVQLAVLPNEVERGLMFRQELGRDEGMLFVFPGRQAMSFWMRNTTLPLDIAYLDGDGVVREIYPLYPLDERPVASRARNLQFALEMNQGWFKDRGVKPGDKLDLAAVRAALVARGLRPEAFNLR
jgi:uncharacterized membrane protein (UPF0127 family)